MALNGFGLFFYIVLIIIYLTEALSKLVYYLYSLSLNVSVGKHILLVCLEFLAKELTMSSVI